MAELYYYQTELSFGRLPNLSEKWGWFLALGVLLLILGGAAIYFDVFSTLLTVGLLGGLLMISGVALLIHSTMSRQWSGFLLNFLLGLLHLVLGFLLIKNPAIGAISLTMLMASFFIVAGLFRSITALMIRFDHWGWFLVSGLITLLLGVLIWLQWPISSLFMLGLFVGIDFLFAGWALVMLALATRNTRHLRSV